MKLRLILILAWAASSGSLLSTQAADEPACHESSCAPTSEKAAIQEALHSFHDALEEDGESHGIKNFLIGLTKAKTWASWVQKLNFKQVGLQTYRVYHLKSENPALRKHAQNLAFIFPISHLTEMLSGPIAVTVANHFGMPAEVLAGIGTAGTIISIPGLDPICLLIYSSYPLAPVQKSITWMRTSSYKMVSWAGHHSGLSSWLKTLKTETDALEILRDQYPDLYSVTLQTTGEAHIELSHPETGETLIALDTTASEPAFERDSAARSISRAILTPKALQLFTASRSSKAQLQKWWAPLHWNIREALNTTFRLATQTQPDLPFFIPSLVRNESNGNFEVSFLKRTVPMPNIKKWTPWETLKSKCAQFLEKRK